MELDIITFYFFADDVLKASHLYDDPQAKMTNAEIITTVLTAARFFCGNQRKAADFLKEHRYIPKFLSESHFNRRLHRISQDIWEQLFSVLSEYFKRTNSLNEYIVDSFPIPICDNIRIFKSKIVNSEKYRGYIANKKRFFYGLRAHMIVTTKQEPVEFSLVPGAENDMNVFQAFNLDLPSNATIHGDKAYTSYEYEDFLEENDIHLVAARKANSKRPLEGCVKFWQKYWRKRIETAFSRITSLFPKHIHAVTKRGFEIKVFSFILVYSIGLIFS